MMKAGRQKEMSLLFSLSFKSIKQSGKQTSTIHYEINKKEIEEKEEVLT